LIVISGVLAIVALALLIAGLASTGLTLVYISIAVSLVSAVFLGIGAYQRRGEEVATAPALPEPSFGGGDEVTRVVTPTAAATASAGSARIYSEAPSSDGAADAPTVLVVPGRPRYHVEGCRYLVGKEAEERSVAEARNEGYTACGICRPDENLHVAAAQAVPELSLVGAGSDNGDEPEEVEPGAAEPAAPVVRPTATKTVKKTTAKTSAKTTAKKATAKKTAATTTKAAPAKKTATKAAPAKTTSAAKKSTATSTATVVVIPDRDKFHTASCRFVKGVRGTAKLPRAEARQQGYQACGVCKP
jgi:hypothetical protein